MADVESITDPLSALREAREFTDELIAAAPLPAGGTIDIPDPAGQKGKDGSPPQDRRLKGLVLRLTPTAKRWRWKRKASRVYAEDFYWNVEFGSGQWQAAVFEAHEWYRRIRKASDEGPAAFAKVMESFRLKFPERDAVLAPNGEQIPPRGRLLVPEAFDLWMKAEVEGGNRPRRKNEHYDGPGRVRSTFERDVLRDDAANNVRIFDFDKAKVSRIFENMAKPTYGWRAEWIAAGRKKGVSLQGGAQLFFEMSRFLGWARGYGCFDRADGTKREHPMDGMTPSMFGFLTTPRKRRRTLSLDEVVEFWEIMWSLYEEGTRVKHRTCLLEAAPMTALTSLLLIALPGRGHSIFLAEKDEIVREPKDAALGPYWKIPTEHFKMNTRMERERDGEAVIMPISPLALDIIDRMCALAPESRFLAASPRNRYSGPAAQRRDRPVGRKLLANAFKRMQEQGGALEAFAAKSRFRPHDFRRTFTTMTAPTIGNAELGIEALGIPHFHAELAVGHAPNLAANTSEGTRKHYDMWDYYLEKKNAVDKWGEFLGRHVRHAPKGKGAALRAVR